MLVPADWEVEQVITFNRTRLTVLSNPEGSVHALIFSLYAGSGWQDWYTLQMKAENDLKGESSESNYNLISLQQVSPTAMRSTYTFTHAGTGCDIEAYGVHLRIPDGGFFLSLRICSAVTDEYDAAFVDRFLDGFTYNE